MYAGITRTCVSTCARVAGTHGNVLNVHTEAFWIYTRFFFRMDTRCAKGRGGVVVSLAILQRKVVVFDHVHEHLNQMLGSSLIANFPLAMNGPRRGIHVSQRFTKRNPCILHIFKFENRFRTTCSRFLQSFALPDEAVQLQTHDTTTQEERKMKEKSGQSRRGSWFLLSFVRAYFDFLTTLTFRALHGSRILSTPF